MEKKRRTPRGSIAAEYARQRGLDTDRIVGAAEIASKFGVTRQRVGQIVASDPTFPRPMTWISGAPLWYRAMVELWTSIHRPAARQDDNPFASTAAAFLAPAERESRRRALGYVVAEHLWLGCLAQESDPVPRVLASPGVSRRAVVATLRMLPQGRRPHDAAPLANSVGMRLEAAVQRVRAAGRTAVMPIDVAIELVEYELQCIANGKPKSEANWFGGREADTVLMALEARGLDPEELRRRLLAAEADPAAVESFEQRPLHRRRRRRARPIEKPPWLGELARDPLGHDPWERHGWGSVFFMTPDGRQYKVDGYQWFFHVDADGYPVRTADGRPVGYRWRVEPTPPTGKGRPLA